MDIKAIISDKSRKPGENIQILSGLLLTGELSMEAHFAFMKQAKPAELGACMEAIEFATQTRPELVTKELFDFITSSLAYPKAPRVKWESAKVVANVCGTFSGDLDTVIVALLKNTINDGTVVRWAAATALSKIMLLKLPYNEYLLPEVEKILAAEEKNSIKKIYLAAIKKITKK